MSHKLPIIKDIELIRVLQKLGFFEHRQSGSHLVMKHEDGRRAVVSVHPGCDIPRGTLKGILRDIQVSNEEFEGLL